MSIKLVIFWIALITLLLFISACSTSTLEGKKLSETELKEIYPCLNVVCSENSYCVDGACVCNANFKLCNENSECIPKTACCSNSDCSEGESCINGQCKFSCSNLEAVSNKICDPAVKGLTCLAGHKWCAEQKKCIPEDHCCSKFDCGRDKRCVPTFWAIELCLEDTAKNCRLINEGEEKLLKTGSTETLVKLTSVFYDQKIGLLVDGKKVDMKRSGRYAIAPDTMLFLARIKDHGGSCQKIAN